MELARRDAERIYVGKEVGACAWPQDKICAVIVAHARQGRRVVRLKSGDPSIFGRATEEIEAARSAGVRVEVVPGVTAASAAAASAQQSLTERGQTDAVVFVTGTSQPGDPDPDWAHHIRSGTTLAIYMGVRSAPRIRAALIAQGADPTTPVDLAVQVSTAKERLFSTDLDHLPETLKSEDISGQALIFVRFAKTQSHVRTAPFALQSVSA